MWLFPLFFSVDSFLVVQAVLYYDTKIKLLKYVNHVHAKCLHMILLAHRCTHTPTQAQRTVPPAQLQHVPSLGLLDGCHGDVIDKVDDIIFLSACN